jgi:hypothetical protein
MPNAIQLIKQPVLRKARLAFNRALPDLATIQRPQTRTDYGPYPARLIAGTANELVTADRLAGRQAWSIQMAMQLLWGASTAFGIGTVVLPTRHIPDTAFKCITGGVTGATEPDWSNGTFPLTDGSCVWARVGFNIPNEVLRTDRVAINGHTLEILDVGTGQTWQFGVMLDCAERN